MVNLLALTHLLKAILRRVSRLPIHDEATFLSQVEQRLRIKQRHRAMQGRPYPAQKVRVSTANEAAASRNARSSLPCAKSEG